MNVFELGALAGAGALLMPRHRGLGAVTLPAAVCVLLVGEAWWRRQSTAADALVAKMYGPPATASPPSAVAT